MPGRSTPLKSFRSDGNIDSTQPTLRIRATKAVILATGGITSDVHFRRMFDPRLTEVYRRRRTLHLSGRQRRAGRHGDRRLALGFGEPDFGEWR